VTRRLALAALLALAGLTALPAAALAYGTGTTWASSSAGTPPGAWAGVAGAGSASDGDAAATLTETDAAGVPAVLHPVNRDFATGASGWTATDTGAVLCSVSSAHDPGAGAPAGSIRTSYATFLNLFNLLAACSSTWRSGSFTWSSGSPSAVGFSMDRTIDLNGLVGAASATWTARLVDETVPGSRVLVTGSGSSDSAWTTQTATGLGPADVVSGHTYHVEIAVSFSSSLSLASGMGAGFDNVALVITPQDQRADGELRAAAVPPGTTHTLELRARTSAEAFDVQVWDGSAWTTRGSVTTQAPAWATLAHGLTPAEWNGGTVRVRFLEAGGAADAAADVLSVEYLRVVSTGGISVSGPTSVTLPPVALDGVSAQVSAGPLAAVEVVDTGGVASGWSLTATATRWRLDGDLGTMLPADALTVAPGVPSTPNGSDLTGVSAGPGGTLGLSPALTLMTAAAGRGVGTYRQDEALSLSVPVTAILGTYRSTITLSAS
jgi:hypothetical protein